jgi:hypothetical protein
VKFIDWLIATNVTASLAALLTLVFKHPEAADAVCAAVPAILGFYHWFTMRDDKSPDMK